MAVSYTHLPYHCGECLELADSSIRDVVRKMNDKQVVDVYKRQGGITSDKLTIANGFITNAMIASLDVAKINAGDISTNKFRIVSDNGGIEIVGATQQFKDKNNKVRRCV